MRREIPRNLARAAADRFVDRRRGQHLVVQQNGESLPSVLAADPAENSRAFAIEREGEYEFTGLRIGGRICARQVLAGKARTPFNYFDTVADGWIRLHDHGARGNAPEGGVLGIDFAHHMECHKGGLAYAALELLRIGDARRLDDDAFIALAHNADFAGAVGIDAAADDFDRLLRGLAAQLAHMQRRHARFDQAVRAVGVNEDIVGGGGRTRQRAQSRSRAFDLSRIDHPHARRITYHAATGVADLRFGLAQGRRHLVGDIVELLAAQRFDIHLEQKLGAAPKVEPKIDRLARHEGWQALAHAFGHKIRKR